MPRGLVELVKVLLDTLGDVLLGGVGAQCVHRRLHGTLLHVWWHVCSLNLQLGGRVGGVFGAGGSTSGGRRICPASAFDS